MTSLGEVASGQLVAKDTIAYTCGGCGKQVHAKVVAKATYADTDVNLVGTAYWCVCPCAEPTVIKMQTAPSQQMYQCPLPIEYATGANWPPDLERLFVEASASFSARAYTASAMVCRKILMAVACKNGDADGKAFTAYVDHIVNNVVPIPSARNAIDAIRRIGNDANHDVSFVSEGEARRALGIATYILNATYSLPSA